MIGAIHRTLPKLFLKHCYRTAIIGNAGRLGKNEKGFAKRPLAFSRQ
jgi:hypothetical protein